MRNTVDVATRQGVRLGRTSGLPYCSLQPTPIISALRHLQRMRGGTQSQLFLGSDSRCWVVKFQNNPQHLRVLANEWIVSSLARAIGFSVPEIGILKVDPWLIENSPGLAMRGPEGILTPAVCGQQFGSLYAGGLMPRLVCDYLPEAWLREVVNLREFAGILLLDKWTGNCDSRQAVFVREKRAKRYKAVFIDFGHCFNAGSWTFPDLPLAGVYTNRVVYHHVTGWESFQPWLTQIQGITLDRLWQCADGLPTEWYAGKSEILDSLIQRLYRRKNLIEMLIHQYRLSDANPFPNWRPDALTAHPKHFDLISGTRSSQITSRMSAP